LIVADTHVVALVNTYLQDFLLMAPLTALSLSLRVYIATIKKTLSIAVVNVIGNIINILSHYICLYQFHWGIHSAPVSITIANVSIVLGYIICIRCSSLYTDTCHSITRDCLREWKIYLKYALPGVVVIL
jgi:Na+-driven multidrug efflux pump